MASSQYDLLLFSETLVSDRGLTSGLLVPAFVRPVLLCQGGMPWARWIAAFARDRYGAFHQPKLECGCCEMLVFRVRGARQNFYVLNL